MQRGPSPQYKDWKKLRDAIDAYTVICEEKDEFPSYAGLLLHLRISKKDAERLQQTEPKIKAEFDRSMLIREDWLSRNMAKDNKRAAGCMNNLKQPINGGYADKTADSGPSELKLNVSGVGGEAAFK